ncbi:hypothetical protein [Aeromonas caviae]|uniref:hypothetical protein n=2 Tax=Aeromonas caviae TaxID=648 RepID=UPI000FEB6B39
MMGVERKIIKQVPNWIATHEGKKAAYSELRYGRHAQSLAEKTYEEMVAGTYDKKRDDLMQRMTYSLKQAAMLLELSSGTLRHWILSGKLHDADLEPPPWDTVGGKEHINAFHLQLAKDRLTAHRATSRKALVQVG